MSRPEMPRLFDPEGPDGFRYRADLITAAQEADLVRAIGSTVQFAAFEMRGVVARRRVAFFGRAYDSRSGAAPPVAAFLLPFRDLVAGWAGIDPQAFAMVLINEYAPGAPIGWHRDAPQYDLVVGLSLLAPCRMKFRPYLTPAAAAHTRAPRRATHEITLDPRSAYILAGSARTAYEHHIPPVTSLRYSVTFRTLR